MPQSPFKTPQFRALFEQWNRVLKEDGFQDAEDFSDPDEPMLYRWHSFGRFKEGGDFSKFYYELASSLLTGKFTFPSDVARRIWELHCQGKSVRRIEQILQSQLIGYKGRRKTNVHTIIQEIQTKSGIKR